MKTKIIFFDMEGTLLEKVVINKLFNYLKSKQITTALISGGISGGFKYQAEKIQMKFKIDLADLALAGCEYYWDKKGYLQHHCRPNLYRTE